MSIAAVGASVLQALPALYLLIMAIAAFLYRDPAAGESPTTHLTVLVPAHNESDLIERCARSLLAQDYPKSRFRVLVVADNCTDDTAELAKSAGASVLVRSDPGTRGKGHALRWAMDKLIASGTETDAFVVVDGDSFADPDLLAHLAAAYERGARVVQADYRVLIEEDAPRVRLRAVAFLLFHRVRFSGRAAMGLPCSLVGNGMLLSRDLMQEHPWDAYTGAEDLEYTIRLRLLGIRPVFAAAARVAGPVPASARAALVQRERWEGGRLHVFRRSIAPLARAVLREHDVGSIDALVDLLVPPLGLLAAAAALTAAALVPVWLTGLLPYPAVIPCLVTGAACTGYVFIGLMAGRAPRWMYASLLSAPRFMVEKILGLRRVMTHRAAHTWIRTERPSEVAY